MIMGLNVRFLVFLLPFIWSSHGASVKKEFSLTPPYTPGGLQDWDLVGNAKVEAQIIRLTEELPAKKGVIWNKNRVLSNSWEVQMNFRITGRKSSGEGIALWYTRDPAEIGPVFGSRDYFSGLGIFIDTVSDQDHHTAQEAYVSAIVNNGSLRFVDSRLIGECQTVGRNLNHPSKIAVSYAHAGSLSVFVDTEGSNQWKLCFTSLGVHLPTGYRFGLSASTDFFTDTHEIISLQMLDLDPADKVWEDRSNIIPFAQNILPPAQHTEEAAVEDEEEEEAMTEEEERAIEEITRKEKERLQELVRKEVEKRKEAEERTTREEKEKQARVISEKREKEEKQKEREERQRKEREEEQRKERENEEKLEREKREIKEEMETKEETAEDVKEEVVSAPVSFTRKAIYVLGTAVIFLIAVKLFRKYNAQRRERLHKRLY